MSTFNYKLKISYDGYDYEGWQIQSEGHRTIQGDLNKALANIAKSKNISSLGSGRTDSGVHANGQVVRVSIPIEIQAESLLRALNSHLPKEIRVLDSVECSGDFHPVRDARWKRYCYLITPERILSPHLRRFVTQVNQPIDWDKLAAALAIFVGEHDFINFSTKGTEVNSTVRTVFLTRLEKTTVAKAPGSCEETVIYKLIFEGSGFLKQMVRLLVGTAIGAGQNKVTNEEIQEYLKKEESKKLAAVAPAFGLYLDHVEYLQEHASLH